MSGLFSTWVISVFLCLSLAERDSRTACWECKLSTKISRALLNMLVRDILSPYFHKIDNSLSFQRWTRHSTSYQLSSYFYWWVFFWHSLHVGKNNIFYFSTSYQSCWWLSSTQWWPRQFGKFIRLQCFSEGVVCNHVNSMIILHM